jgi:hypothetical protein
MNEHKWKTYRASIYLGLKEGYEGPTHEYAEILEYCGTFCRNTNTAVSVTPTVFVYARGSEPGAITGLTHGHNSQRREEEIRRNALELGQALLEQFNQTTVSVLFPDETIDLWGCSSGIRLPVEHRWGCGAWCASCLD